MLFLEYDGIKQLGLSPTDLIFQTSLWENVKRCHLQFHIAYFTLPVGDSLRLSPVNPSFHPLYHLLFQTLLYKQCHSQFHAPCFTLTAGDSSSLRVILYLYSPD